LYAHFLRNLLYQVRGNVVLVHDGGMMHKGPPIRAVRVDHPRLHLHMVPPYAPELNPVEYLWTYTKSHQLANFVPMDIAQIDTTVCAEMEVIRHDQPRLRSFFRSTPLPWNNTPLLF
jgi:transposase